MSLSEENAKLSSQLETVKQNGTSPGAEKPSDLTNGDTSADDMVKLQTHIQELNAHVRILVIVYGLRKLSS